MADFRWLAKGINQIVKTFEYPAFQIDINQNIDCVCKGFSTKQGDPTCKRCLGTGQKIEIKENKIATEDSSSSFRGQGINEKGSSTTIYVRSDFPIKDQDMIVDKDTVYVVHRSEMKKGTEREVAFYKCSCIKKKSNVSLFLKNFREIVGE